MPADALKFLQSAKYSVVMVLCERVVGHGASSPVSQWAATDAGGREQTVSKPGQETHSELRANTPTPTPAPTPTPTPHTRL